ncbi:alpha-amylase family glycosyl hydrolase [Actinoplanes sp. NPDC026670]|uniref:alpha-amylase family glycosyl hydrolase n=1 Tax=Actinoplanes sp. NPDC026670 TaxID=3154700 RepID=UPI0033F5FAD1
MTARVLAPWWRDAVGYQIYLPSFADADGDGWGDLAGVTARLDHLTDLGVDVLWLTPFFVSPMVDHGYDVADYRTVDPLFGGDEALQELLAQAHARGLRVIGDLVVNHTSDQHPWFRASASSRDDPYRDYYIWRDPAPSGGPPNNWVSQFGGSAWAFDERTGQYYLHLFRPEQPDLNWRNPAVADEVDALLAFWAGRGLDGFRIDTAAYLLKHPDLPDNPLLPDGTLLPVGGATLDFRRQDHRYDIHQPDVHAIHERWRQVADRHHLFLIGEVYELDPGPLAEFVSAERLHSTFWFGLVDVPWDAKNIAALLTAAAGASPGFSWAQGNHDRSRAATRYGRSPGGVDLLAGRRRSLALHTLMSVLPGVMWLYQGEELGLGDGVVPAELAADPLAAVQPDQGRDRARTPMPWSPGKGWGFTDGRPWLSEGGRHPSDTAAVQLDEPGSHLNAIRRLLHTRRWIAAGAPFDTDVVVLDDGARALCRGRIRVLANLDDTTTDPIDLPAPAVYDTDDPRVSPQQPRTGTVRLAPQQALILVTGL